MFTRDAHPQRWRACEQALEAVLSSEPAVRRLESLYARLKEHSGDGDPFADVADQLLVFVRDPENWPKGDTPAQMTVEMLEIFAAKIRDTVAERLGHGSAGFLTVRVVEDWDINAQVATEPPYDVVVSTNLVSYCSEMSTLLTEGLGLTLTDAEGNDTGKSVTPAASVDAIAGHVRILMDAILRGEEIPIVPRDADPAHYTFALIVFYSAMTFLTCHEFGHVVISESRRRGEAPPFGDFAEALLRPVFDRLIAGKHRYDPRGLEGHEGMDLAEVFRNWADEITSDIVGASLALEYQSRQGPWAGVSDIGAYSRLGIHLALVAQMMLGIYALWMRRDPVMTPSHPPTDFRTFCVLQWLYRDKHATAENPIAHYAGSILERILEGLKSGSA